MVAVVANLFFGSFATAQEGSTLRSAQQKYSDGFVVTLYDADKRDQQFEQILSSVSSAGIRHMSFGVIATQTNKFSNAVVPDLVQNRWALRQVRRLKRMGFTTSFIPIMFGTEDQSWRGHFAPSNPAEWFRSYSEWIVGLAEAGQAAGLAELSIISEMNQMYTRHESSLVLLMNNVRSVFQGATFVTLHNLSSPPLALIRSGDFVSVSAYTPVSRGWFDDSCDNSLSSYVAQLTNLSRRVGRPIHITEIGYPSVAGGMREPWNFSYITDARLAVSEADQTCGYDAIYGAMASNTTIHRIQLWELTDTTAPEHPKSYSPVGKPAWNQVLRLIQTRSALR